MGFIHIGRIDRIDGIDPKRMGFINIDRIDGIDPNRMGFINIGRINRISIGWAL
jgi:hypothetical protein